MLFHIDPGQYFGNSRETSGARHLYRIHICIVVLAWLSRLSSWDGSTWQAQANSVQTTQTCQKLQVALDPPLLRKTQGIREKKCCNNLLLGASPGAATDAKGGLEQSCAGRSRSHDMNSMLGCSF